MIPEEYEPHDDGSLSPRSVLLSPDTVRSILERPTDPAKRAPEARFSNIESRLQGLRQTTPAAGQQVAAAALDFRQLRRLLRDTSDKLEATTKRANKAETHARDARARTFALEVQYQNAREQNIRATEELKLYKAELQRAQLEVQRAQQEINSLVTERDRAEEDAARSRDMARKATETLRLQQAREEGIRQGIEQGRRQGFMEGRAQGMEEAVASATAKAKRQAFAAMERVLREDDPMGAVAGELGNGGPSRRASVSSAESLAAQRAAAAAAATLTPIQEALLETSPAPTEGLQMPAPHPAQRPVSPAIPTFETTPADAAPPRTEPGFVVPPQPQQPVQPIPQMSFTDALGEPIQRTQSPRPGMFAPAGSPAPHALGFSPGGLGAGGSGLGVGGPHFTANVIPPTPVPSTPSSTHMMQPNGMPQPAPVAPMAFPMGVAGPSSDPFPPMGVAGPSSEPYPPGSSMGFNGGFASPQAAPMHVPPSPGRSEIRDAFDPVVFQPKHKKKMRRPRQDSQGSVPLIITPASPQDSIDTPPSSDDDARTSRTSRSTRRGPGAPPGLLSPRHIPRPPSRRASPSQPHSSRDSSPHVVITDAATGAPVRVSMRVAGDLVEQELEDRRREEAERAMGGRSPLLPRSPHTGYSPLPGGGPPLPPSGGTGFRDLPGGGGNRMSMYGGAPGTARSRASQLPYEQAPGSVPYPRPVSPLPRRASPMAFPTSNGTSILEAVIPGVNVTSGYTPAPLDGAAYPAPVTPAPRAFDAMSRASPTSTVGFGLVGPNRATSPTPSQPAFMLSPRAISPRPIIPPVVPPISRAGSPNPMFPGVGDPPRSRSPRPRLGMGVSPAQSARHSVAPGGVIPFIPSRPVSRAGSLSASMARTDQIHPRELPGSATYEAAPNAPFYPPPPTPARVPIPPSPAISRVSRRSNTTTRTPRQPSDGAIFDMPPGGWSSLR